MAEEERTIDEAEGIPEIHLKVTVLNSEAAPIDTTLTRSEYAADAETVGTEIGDSQTDIYDVETEMEGIAISVAEAQSYSAAEKTQAQINLGIVDLIYPVGSIYMSLSQASPATIFPGTNWDSIANGTFLYAVTRGAESQGGNASNTIQPDGTIGKIQLSPNQTGVPEHTHDHSLTMPAHSHSFSQATANAYAKIEMMSVESGTGTNVIVPNANGSDDSNMVEVKLSSEDVTGTSPQMPCNGYVDIAAPVGASQGHDHTFTGTQQQISILPPYIAVYMYRRRS